MNSDIGETFVERTKYVHLPPSAQQMGQPQPPLEKPFDGAKTIDLPAPDAFRAEPAR